MTPSIDHDAIFKELLSTFFVDFIELFAPRVLDYAEIQGFSLEPTETVREVFAPVEKGKKKTVDLVARVSFRDSEACFLIHIESQSSAYSEEDLRWRMFYYFSRLHEKFQLPVYPIALLTFDKPEKERNSRCLVTFPDCKVLEFNFVSIQLNRLNWRDFLKRENPVASALMAKMKIAPEERAQVKAECLRLLATLELNQKKMELISGFIGTYLRLNEQEEEVFEQILDSMELKTKERVMLFYTDWEEKGREKGRQEVLQEVVPEVRREGRKEDIFRVLKARFQDTPLTLKELIEKINDLETLGNLLVQAATTPSLGEFESVVRSMA